MLKKVLEYAGDYRKKTYQAIATMLIGVGMNILPFLFIYQIITPLIRSAISVMQLLMLRFL